ncbi:MAG TPA: SDR family oxidoreductase [Actinocrinis sp.]|jgi:nucleoside-diphosphate-sugar epimerase
MSGLVLITGADGYVGRRTAQRMLAETDERLVLSVRAADRAEFAAKHAGLSSALGEAAAGRIRIVPADLAGDAPMAEVTREVTVIVHAAARTEFNLPRPDAQRVNVEGTVRVAEFAAGCPSLQRFVLVSTLISAGRSTGVVPETLLSGHEGFVNHYEWSKHEAERRVAQQFPGLPLTIARLSTLIADDEHGHATQHNAFHNTLKLFFYGLVTIVPGLPDTRLYLATAAATSGALVHLADPATPAGVYHLAPSPELAVSLRETVDTAFDVFETDESFTRRRLLRPEFCDLEAFRTLVAATQMLSASPAAGALRSVAPFAEQLFCPKSFDNSSLMGSWPGGSSFGAAGPLVEAVCTSLVRTRWGRRSAGETQLAVPIGATP